MIRRVLPRMAILFIAVFSACCVIAAELNATEKEIVAAVKKRSDPAMQLLERIVKINSGTMNHDGVREVGQLMRSEFDHLGFSTRWVDMPREMERAGHLIAHREGRQGKRLLLIGHLDTVFERDSTVPLWDRRGNRVRGQGVYDMKGGDVIILEALRALHKVGALADTTVSVVMTGDEERVGMPIEIARKDLVDIAKNSDVALAFETTLLDKTGRETATIGRRASGSWTLTVTGKQGHSSMIFGAQAGYGAVYEAARIINTFREQLIEPDLTFNAALILGGTDINLDDAVSKGTAFGKNNVIAKSAIVRGDLRYLTNAQRDRAYSRMREIVSKSLSGTSAEISFDESYPAMAPTAGNLRLLQAYSEVSQDAGLGGIEPVPPGLRGAGDIQFVAPYIDSLDGIGASGEGLHSPTEELDVSSMERATIRAALLIYRLTR